MSKNVPENNKTQSITIRIDKNKIETLKNISHKENVSRNKLILQFIDFAIQHLEPDN